MHWHGWLAARQDTIEAMRPERADDDAQMAGMLRVAKHRRECHMRGHRADREKGQREAARCDRCTPEKCMECKAESLAVWEGKRWALARQGTEIIKAGLVCQDARETMTDQEAIFLLLFLSL